MQLTCNWRLDTAT